MSPRTRKKVLELADRLNYVPNSAAVNLRTKQTKTIGVLVPTIVHQFFSKVINAIMEEAERHGYLVITLQSNESFELEKKQLNLLLQKRVDGILISLSNETYRCNHINAIIENGIPIVMFGKINKLVNCSKVYINDQQAAYKAVAHLIEKGYKRIAHFRGSLTPQNSIDLFLGYKKALLDNAIEFDPSLVYICDANDDFNDGYNQAKKMLVEQTDVDAVFAVTDVVAVGVLKCFNDSGIKIPKEIAVFGFSDWFMASVVTPTLSSVRQPSFEMGRKATELLIEEIHRNEKEIYTTKDIILPTSLVLRQST